MSTMGTDYMMPTQGPPVADRDRESSGRDGKLSQYIMRRKNIPYMLVGFATLVALTLLVVIICLQMRPAPAQKDAADRSNQNITLRNNVVGKGSVGAEPKSDSSRILPASRSDEHIQDCLTGSLKQTFPNIDYSMYGYNILLGYPLEDGRDPGFTRALFAFDFSAKGHTADCRYMVPHGLTAAPDVSCTTSFTSTLVEDSADIEKSLGTHAQVSAGAYGVSFSASAGYQRASKDVATGERKIIYSTADCKYYFTKLDELDMPDYSVEVVKWLEKMNKSIQTTGAVDDALIYNFFDYFGTHFAGEVVYGARYTFKYSISAQDYSKMSASGKSVEVQASYTGEFNLGVGVGFNDSKKDMAKAFRNNVVTSTKSIGAPPPIDGNAATWASTVKDFPVPVQYRLVPIYDLFSPKYSTKPYLNETAQNLIKIKMMSLITGYCRRLSASGVDVICNDASVIKFADVSLSGSSLNKTLVDCINECIRRKNCTLLSYWAKGTEPSRRGIQCQLGFTITNQTNFTRCTNCSLFIMPQALTSYLKLGSMTYGNSVPRRNKMNIQGFKSYEHLTTLCATSCSLVDDCIGFEVSNRSDFIYNCATYNTHSTVLVETDSGVFETQLMSDLAKRKSLEHLRHTSWYSGKIDKAKLDDAQTTGSELRNCNGNCCRDRCRSNVNCLAGVHIEKNGSRSCRLLMNSHTARLTLHEDSPTDSVEIFAYYERVVSGWLNITWESSSSQSNLQSAEECARQCTEQASCIASAWDSDTRINCTLHDIATLKNGIHSYLNKKQGSSLMFSNFQSKFKKFELRN